MGKNDSILDRANQELDALVAESISNFLTAKLLGLCAHEWEETGRCNKGREEYNVYIYKCSKCGEEGEDHEFGGYTCFTSPSEMFTWEGLGKLWEALQNDSELWSRFARNNSEGARFSGTEVTYNFPQTMFNPATFPILVAQFLGWGKEEE